MAARDLIHKTHNDRTALLFATTCFLLCHLPRQVHSTAAITLWQPNEVVLQSPTKPLRQSLKVMCTKGNPSRFNSAKTIHPHQSESAWCGGGSRKVNLNFNCGPALDLCVCGCVGRPKLQIKWSISQANFFGVAIWRQQRNNGVKWILDFLKFLEQKKA